MIIQCNKAQIISTGSYAPPKLITNTYFNDFYKEDVDTFLKANRNIFQRYYAEDNQVTSDLAVEAAKKALDNAGLKPEQIDLIILSTDTPDYISPSTCSAVQYKLGAVNAGTFDINSACAGFVTAVSTGAKFIESDDDYKYVLIIGAYLMSRFLNYEERNIATLFADGAGAVVLSKANSDNCILKSVMKTEGEYHNCMGIYAGGTYKPLSQNVLNHKQHLLKFTKKIPAEFNIEHWPKILTELSNKTCIPLTKVNHIFFTQININSINKSLDILNLPHSISHNIMDKYGYTGNACIAMAMDDAVNNHLLKKDDNVFLVSSGGGASLAALSLKWSYDT